MYQHANRIFLEFTDSFPTFTGFCFLIENETAELDVRYEYSEEFLSNSVIRGNLTKDRLSLPRFPNQDLITEVWISWECSWKLDARMILSTMISHNS